MRIPAFAVSAMLSLAAAVQGQAVKTVVDGSPGHWRLLRNGQPYYIDGVAGATRLKEFKALGGNSVRTWRPSDVSLKTANDLGLTVCVGLHLEPEGHGFSYSNANDVARQYELARAAIEQFKNEPALLAWGVGNEVEGFQNGDNPAIWSAIESIAAMAHRLDPNHPTLAVVAEIAGQRVPDLHRLCPDIDIVGINSYGNLSSVPERYAAAGGIKPYIVTEFGPMGWWETDKTSWGAPIEATSSQKAEVYEKGYLSAVVGQPGKCLGSYAFLWGTKHEATATWFNLLLADGTRLNAVSTLSALWRGCHCGLLAPSIEPVHLAEPALSHPGAVLHASVTASADGPLTYEWQIHREADQLGVGGDVNTPTHPIAESLEQATTSSVIVTLPSEPGNYRLYVFVRDAAGYGATANVPLRAE